MHSHYLVTPWVLFKYALSPAAILIDNRFCFWLGGYFFLAWSIKESATESENEILWNSRDDNFVGKKGREGCRPTGPLRWEVAGIRKPEEAYTQMRTMCDRVRGCVRSSVSAVSGTLPRETEDWWPGSHHCGPTALWVMVCYRDLGPELYGH